jgi:hydroxymethylbilane synthase
MEISFGTRKSKWALAATNAVIERATEHSPDVRFHVVQLDSPGDLNHGDLAKLGGTTSFVDALSKEVAAGTIDAAVHTVKDISWPSSTSDFPDGAVLPRGLRTTGNLLIAAVGARNDPRDALVFRRGESFDSFDNRAIRIGTGSLVRAAALRTLFPDAQLTISRIRGNIDLRLDKLDQGEFDALILSMDGLLAVGRQARASRIFEVDEMPPALGQAIGAVETREDNERALAAIGPVNDPVTQTCLRAEWAALRGLEATCHTPVGGLCSMNSDGTLSMFARILGPGGERIEAHIEKAAADAPERLGAEIAQQLMAQGAKDIETSWREHAGELSQDAT